MSQRSSQIIYHISLQYSAKYSYLTFDNQIFSTTQTTWTNDGTYLITFPNKTGVKELKEG